MVVVHIWSCVLGVELWFCLELLPSEYWLLSWMTSWIRLFFRWFPTIFLLIVLLMFAHIHSTAACWTFYERQMMKRIVWSGSGPMIHILERALIQPSIYVENIYADMIFGVLIVWLTSNVTENYCSCNVFTQMYINICMYIVITWPANVYIVYLCPDFMIVPTAWILIHYVN